MSLTRVAGLSLAAVVVVLLAPVQGHAAFAPTDLQVAITPSQPLQHAHLAVIEVAAGTLQGVEFHSLGSLPAVTTNTTIAAYVAADRTYVYTLLALHQTDDQNPENSLVAVGLQPADAAGFIAAAATWDQAFAGITGAESDIARETYDASWYFTFRFLEDLVRTLGLPVLGATGTIVNFSGATPGGTVYLAPEPATAVLLLIGAVSVVGARRPSRRIG